MRELRARINEHRAGIRQAFKNKDFSHSIYGHFAKGHGKNPEFYLEVIGIERVLPRGDDLLRKARGSPTGSMNMIQSVMVPIPGIKPQNFEETEEKTRF